MSKHTPGPWSVKRANQSPTTGEWMVGGSRPGYLAEVRDCGSGDVEANANLIAAAPDLLEALQSCIAALIRETAAGSHLSSEFAKARAAIAKATGDL